MEDSALTSTDWTNVVMTDFTDSWDGEDPDYSESDYEPDSEPEDIAPGTSGMGSCSICLKRRTFVILRPCCQLPSCQPCMSQYLDMKVSSGVVSIQCPGSGCDSYLKEYEISTSLEYDNSRLKFHKLLINVRNDPTCKTCPRCGQEMKLEQPTLRYRLGLMFRRVIGLCGHPVTCQSCALKWCFACHAPWHEGVTCEEYVLGDRKFRNWVKSRGPENQTNAQRCPSCQTYIQRNQGCDSMTCVRCGANFCYQCGYQFPITRDTTTIASLRRFYMGEHADKWSPLSCSANLWPNLPFLRKLLKGLILGGKVLGTILLPPILLVLSLALAVVVAIPVLAGIMVCPKVRQFYEKRLQTRIPGPMRYLKTTMALSYCWNSVFILGALGIIGFAGSLVGVCIAGWLAL